MAGKCFDMASSGKILIIDDSEDDRLLCYHTFRRLGLRELVVQLKDGEEAIEYLQRDRSAALILLDLKMPKLSGFEVLQWIRGQPGMEKFPVVIMTSSPLPSERSKALDLGANEFHVKPDFAGLRNLMTGLVQRFVGNAER
jgi:CheY-like chemotaxis protein